MKLFSELRRVLLCLLCATGVCSAVFAKPATLVKASENSKTGVVTSISLDAKKNTVTVTLALCTLKAPSTDVTAEKPDRNMPPKRPSLSDMIELTGETVTFTVSADTEVARSMLLAPAKDTTDATAAPTDDQLPPPPPDGKGPEGFPPEHDEEISQVTINDVLTITYDTTGTTVTTISEDDGEPPHGPDGMTGPRPDMNGGPHGGQMGPGPQGGMGGPSGGRR